MRWEILQLYLLVFKEIRTFHRVENHLYLSTFLESKGVLKSSFMLYGYPTVNYFFCTYTLQCQIFQDVIKVGESIK